jgi:iron complex transport system permease protein
MMTTTSEPPVAATDRWRVAPALRAGRFPAASVAPVVVVVFVGVGSVLVGSRAVPLEAVLDPAHPLHPIVDARIARTLAGALVGAALGLAGAALQSVTRNPLADPGLLGINAGASLAMVVGISAFGLSGVHVYVLLAFAGGAAAAVVVHAIAAVGRVTSAPATSLIAGAALAAALSSVTTAVLLLDRSTMESFRYWQVGSIGGRDLAATGTVAPVVLVAAVLLWLSRARLDSLALGDDVAAGLGVRVGVTRLVVGGAAVLLAASATALAGPIAFVGLLVPHTARALVGPGHHRLLPLTAVLGSGLLVLADTIGRVIIPPGEVQVGIMTALVGLPAFVWAMRRALRSKERR